MINKKLIHCICTAFLVVVCSCNQNIPKEVTITFDGTTATVANPLAKKGVAVTVSGADVTVASTLLEEVTYKISGTTTDGNLKIYSDFKLILVLNEVQITNTDGPAINIQSGKKTTLMLNGTNKLTDGAVYQDFGTEDMKATLFSEGQIIFGGTGLLEVYSINRHAICSDDYVVINGGTINITAAGKDGIHAKDYVECNQGALSIKCTSDGIDCSAGHIAINGGTITIKSGDEGIVTSLDTLITPELATIIPYITINGGTIDIETDSIRGHGIQSAQNITINDGTITILTKSSKSDGIHCSAVDSIIINGGTIDISAADDCYKGILIDETNSLKCN